MDIFYVIAGFVVGFVIGLSGVGGGSLMTPLLVLGFGIKPAIAVGTDLLYAAITKGSGVFVHHRRRNVDWRIVGQMAVGSIPSTLATLLLLKQLRMQGIDFEGLITTALGIALILTSLVLVFKGSLERLSQKEQLSAVRALHRYLQGPMTVFSGVLIGALVTLSSVGAGALGAAILFFLYPRMRVANVVGTDLAHAVPLTAIAGFGHLHLGTVNLELLAYLVLGSLPGIYMGSHLSTLVPEKLLRLFLAGLLFLVGAKVAI